MVRIPNIYYRNSSADRPLLRVGVIVDSPDEVPAFAATIIEDVRASNFARIELLIVRRPDEAAPPAFLYDLYLRLDARMKPANDPLAMTDCRDLLAGIDRIEAVPSSAPIPSDVENQIRSRNLDVVVDLGSAHLSGGLLKAARYGVWSYHFGDTERYRGGPSHFWELYEGASLSGADLRVLSDPPVEGVVLAKAQFTTEQTLSVSRNRFAPYWGSTELVIAKLNELHRLGWNHVLQRALPPVPHKGKRAVYTNPTNGDMLPWIAPILIKKAVTYPFRRELAQHWRIAIRMQENPLFESQAGFAGFRWIEAPSGRAWADPFVFEHDEKFWAFFEDYSYADKRAGIACAEIAADGTFGPPLSCLSHPRHHYSYPHIFRDGDQIFMIPESFDSNSIDLYRCRKFPDEWVHEKVLFEGKFVDTTLWQHDGSWWLATTSADPGPGAGSLLLFFSDALKNKWQFHPANPISTDIRRNRGAGCILRAGNRLIRPSQSCAPTYGYSFAFNEITELTTASYAERLLSTIAPEHWPGIAGVHTYNRAGKIEVIDGRSPVPLARLLTPQQ